MKIAFIYMASGFGRRFGENKLLIDFSGKPLYLYGLSCLIEVKNALENLKPCEEEKTGNSKKSYHPYNDGANEERFEIEILVVSQYEQILKKARELGLKSIQNTKSDEGIAASLRLGTAAARENTDAFFYFVADQPYMDADTIEAFVRNFLKSQKGIGAVSFEGKRRNPAAFLRKYKDKLLLLHGDRGGSTIIKQYLDDLWLMEVEKKIVIDIDTREDMEEKLSKKFLSHVDK